MPHIALGREEMGSRGDLKVFPGHKTGPEDDEDTNIDGMFQIRQCLKDLGLRTE